MTLSEVLQVVTICGVILTGILGVMGYYRAGRAVDKVTAVDERVQHIDVKVDGRLSQLLDVITESEHAKGLLAGVQQGIEQEKIHADEVAQARAEEPPVIRSIEPPSEPPVALMLKLPHFADSIIGTFTHRNRS